MKTRLPMTSSSIIKKLIPTSVATGNQSLADPSVAKVNISGAETGAAEARRCSRRRQPPRRPG